MKGIVNNKEDYKIEHLHYTNRSKELSMRVGDKNSKLMAERQKKKRKTRRFDEISVEKHHGGKTTKKRRLVGGTSFVENSKPVEWEKIHREGKSFLVMDCHI